MLQRIAGASVLACCLSGFAGAAGAQLKSPSFTVEQLERGKQAYAVNCAACHGAELSDGEFAPPLKGSLFGSQWGGQSLDALYRQILSTMPPVAPGSLPIV